MRKCHRRPVCMLKPLRGVPARGTHAAVGCVSIMEADMKRWNAWLGAALICAQVQASDNSGPGGGKPMRVATSEPDVRVLEQSIAEARARIAEAQARFAMLQERERALENAMETPEDLMRPLSQRFRDLARWGLLDSEGLALHCYGLAQARRRLGNREPPPPARKCCYMRLWLSDPILRGWVALPSVVSDLNRLSWKFRRDAVKRQGKAGREHVTREYVKAVSECLNEVGPLLCDVDAIVALKSADFEAFRRELGHIYFNLEVITSVPLAATYGYDRRLLKRLLSDEQTAAVLYIAWLHKDEDAAQWSEEDPETTADYTERPSIPSEGDLWDVAAQEYPGLQDGTAAHRTPATWLLRALYRRDETPLRAVRILKRVDVLLSQGKLEKGGVLSILECSPAALDGLYQPIAAQRRKDLGSQEFGPDNEDLWLSPAIRLMQARGVEADRVRDFVRTHNAASAELEGVSSQPTLGHSNPLSLEALRYCERGGLVPPPGGAPGEPVNVNVSAVSLGGASSLHTLQATPGTKVAVYLPSSSPVK